MSDCKLRVGRVWECPVCGRQAAVLAGEADQPFVCDFGHRTVEMEQRLPEAFEAERQGWSA